MEKIVETAKNLIKFYRFLESQGVEHETSVDTFTSAMWAELVFRGMVPSEDLALKIGEALTEVKTIAADLGVATD